jgi:hypothetical protein
MLSTLIVLVVSASSVWVYLDATKHKIGKIPDGGPFNSSAGLWGTATLLLWIIVLPMYLIKRRKMIERAQEHPVTVRGRGLKAGILSFIGGLWFLSALSSAGPIMPTGSPSTTGAAQIIKEGLKNPDSLSVKSSKVLWSGPYEGRTAYLVEVVYTATNSFGGTIQNCKIVAFSRDEQSLYWSNLFSPLNACENSEEYRQYVTTMRFQGFADYLDFIRDMHFSDDATQ